MLLILLLDERDLRTKLLNYKILVFPFCNLKRKERQLSEITFTSVPVNCIVKNVKWHPRTHSFITGTTGEWWIEWNGIKWKKKLLKYDQSYDLVKVDEVNFQLEMCRCILWKEEIEKEKEKEKMAK